MAGNMADEQGFEPITTQEQFDSIIKERIERAKRSAVPEDYDELKAKADRLDDAETRAERAESEAARLRHAAELDGWKAEVASKTGVPTAVLRGDTLEDIQAHADAIKASMPVYPQVSEQGGQTPPMGRREILSIKNARERKAAILANLDQF